MIAFALLTLATFTPASVDVLFPHGKDAARLRVAVTIDGRSPELAWAHFLDKLFDYFDRDGNGQLSPAEAARVFSLPLPGGRSATSSKDGFRSRAEFREFYRANGFTSVVANLRPPTVEQRRLSAALFRQLDRDTDGKLTRDELVKAHTLLRRLDENEDELLTPVELVALEPSAKDMPSKTFLDAVAPTGTDCVVLRLELGKNPRVPLEGTNTFRVPGGLATISPSPTKAQPGGEFRTAKGFYLAQFTDALGDKPSLTKADLEADTALQTIAGMFDAADRDGNGKLTAAELRAFLDLVELGLGCQVVVNVEDRGANLFDLLDANGDDILDLGELNGAVRTCEQVAELPLKRDVVPQQFRLTLTRVTASSAFGPVPIPQATTVKPLPKAAAARGPRWFTAMDKNGDGFISPAEFIGSQELFRNLDLNGDGRLSVEEAEQANAKR